jgi:gamma-glutamyltranspeptidase/glutathione hydrolase
MNAAASVLAGLCRPNPKLSAAAFAAALVIGTMPAQALDRSVAARQGMIVAGHPLAVESGMKVLQAGGNACDAAIAVAATLSTMMSDMMGPAGSGYALIWNAEKREVTGIDYNGVAPLKTDPKLFDMSKKLRGPMAPTVPGALKGWEAVHKKCGSRPWAELWQDAINYAENGRALDEDSAFHIRRLIPEIGIYDSWVKEFLANGEAMQPGGILVRKDLANSYRAFAAQGSDALYKGEVGARLVAFMEKNGGLISREDLAKYEVRWVEPIKTTYRGYTILGIPPTASSMTWMETLKILEGYDLAALKQNSAEYLRVFIEATKYAYMDSYRYNIDSSFGKTPVEKLLSDDYAKEIRGKIDKGYWDLKPVKTTWYDKRPNQNTATSHLEVIDRWGNAVSMTNTLGTFFGAGVVAEGTGLVLSNGMDWFDIDENIWTGEKPGNLVMAPGKRNRWTLAPGMMFKDDKLYMLIGGAGAEATMWGIAQPVVNAIDFKMDPQKALSAPRFRYGDLYHYTGGTEVFLESGIDPSVGPQLAAWGYKMANPTQPRNSSSGTTQMIVIDPVTGAYFGGAARYGRDFVAGY